MNTIPVSQLVNVNPAVLAAAGTLDNLVALLLTNSANVPIGSVSPFASAQSVGAFFGLSSPEYAMAQIYFAAPTTAKNTPATLMFGQYPSAPVGAYLRSAALSLTLTQLQALTGTLAITADGTLNTSASINLSAATSFSNAATLLLAGFTSPTFTIAYNSQLNAFVVTSGTTGESSTLAFAGGTLAASLSLTQATGAVISNGAIAATPATAMASFAQLSQAWATFSTVFEPDLADKTAFSLWTSLQNDNYAYVGFDSDVNNLTPDTTATWAYAVKENAYDGSIVIFGTNLHAALALGWAGSLNFNALNGRTTLAYQQQAGLAPYVTDGQSAATLKANGCNFYGSYGIGSEQFDLFQDGSISGRYLWADSFMNQIWLRQNLQASLLQLEMQAGTIPYNSDGYSLINAACADPIAAAVNYGAIRVGVVLSASQKQQLMQAIGVDVSSAIQAQGYYLQVVPATSATRVARASPVINLYYTDGQSIQTISATATEIQ